jgi:4-diphosphocytidyl-2-C-methyl-D-erythritol kinase
VIERAPAKVNLVLRVGPPRPDGLHELASLFASIDLADELEIEEAERDEVICPGVAGDNLAARALAAFREAGGDPPPLRVTIDKRIPVAAGLGGGSADAAAVLRAAQGLSPIDEAALAEAAAALGSDVPSQLKPAHAIVTGTGERVEPVSLPPMTLLLVPDAEGLSTAEVYAELDRLRPGAPEPDPAPLQELVKRPRAEIVAAMANDLERAALSLRPDLEDTKALLTAAGARNSLISGSGPTVVGVFFGRVEADEAASRLPQAIVTELAP